METIPSISGMRRAILTLGVSLGLFMNVLDASITNVALRTIAGELGISVDDGTWVITSFSASQAIILPITGWLSKRFGEVRIFLISTALFIVTSVLCGLSVNMGMLVIARALQGAVAGPMIPLSQSLLMAGYPPERKNFAVSIWSMVAVVGPILGPILGGWISDNYDWRWIFYVNVPFGILALVMSYVSLKGVESPIVKNPVDVIGFCLLALGVGSLQVMLDRGYDMDWFRSNLIICLAVISIIALSFLIAWELTDKNPIVDLKLFANRNFSVGVIALGVGVMLYFTVLVVFPLWLQNNMGYTPTWAGLAAAPMGILPFFLTPLLGRFAYKFDPRIMASIGFLFFALTSFWQSTFYIDVGYATMLLPRMVQGIGMSLFFVPVIAIIVSDLPADHTASGLGLAYFFRAIGGSFGTSLSVYLWERRAALYQNRLIENITDFNPISREFAAQLQANGFQGDMPYGMINQIITNQAFMLATNDIMWLLGWIFIAILILLCFAKKPQINTGQSKAPQAAEG